MAGEWIGTSDPKASVGYYRRPFTVAGQVRTAWLAVAAQENFQLIVNGKVFGTQSLWRPNRPYQFTMSERGQRVNSAQAIPWVSYARDYQWKTYDNFRLPIFYDISRALLPGENAICVKVDSRTASNSLCVDGGILLDSGQEITMESGPSWRTVTIPPRDGAIDWTDGKYNDLAWEKARSVAPPGVTFRTFDPAIFTHPFEGRWLRASPDGVQRSLWFERTWRLEEKPEEAWIRVMVNRSYDVYVNGRKAEPPSVATGELGASDWVVRTKYAEGGQGRPGVLDPDDAASIFGDSQEDVDEESEAGTSPALLGDRQVSTYEGYSIGTMLHAGENTVTIRLVQRDASLKWSRQFALDGMARGPRGVSRIDSSSSGWRARLQAVSGEYEEVSVIEAGMPKAAGTSRPRLRYMGNCYWIGDKLCEWAVLGGAVAFLILGAAGCLLWQNNGPPEKQRRVLTIATAGTFMAAAVLVCAIVLDCCFAVRDEILWMSRGRTWSCVLLGSAIAGMVTCLLFACQGYGMPKPWKDALTARRHGFKFAMAGVLLLCGLTRSYRLEFQPTDADEWASLQTILAIADTGIPKLTDDVFYTRSPLYHYTVAGTVAVFGRNILALRLPSVFFAVATCALIYLCGRRLLGSRWVGLAGAALFAIHPLAIGMGHQIRFYQQQQFFALLTVYFFCRGFVSEQSMKYRYLAMVSFFAAVFSQEISVMIGFTLVPSYLLFAEGKDWRSEGKWLIAGACGLVFVVLDFVIFQTVCLTRLDGVSPRVEPALKLNLMFPSTLYWIFSLFSRLHFGLSAIFFLGVPFALRGHHRNVLALYLTFVGGLVFSTILITGSGIRFQYWLIPIFILLTVHGVKEFAKFVLTDSTPELRRQNAALRWAMAATFVLMIGLSWSPWKIPGSYSTKILPDVDGALAYVRQNIGPNDAFAITAPHTAAALTEVGRVDYDIEVPMLNDFVYRKNGRLIDRNAGAEVIQKLGEFQDACARHQRLWIVLNRDIRFRSPGEKIAWQDPGGRFDLFIRTNLELKHQTYLTDVYLWDSSKGRLRTFRRSL